MRVKTLPQADTIITQSTKSSIQETIQKSVDERGFYLYEWISREEFRKSIQSDYLTITRYTSIPLAILTFIAGLIGAIAGPMGIIGAALLILIIFASIVSILLIAQAVRKSYLYARGADIIITDDHYISGGKVLKKEDFHTQKEAFRLMESIFREPLFAPSELQEYVDFQKKSVLEQFTLIAKG